MGFHRNLWQDSDQLLVLLVSDPIHLLALSSLSHFSSVTCVLQITVKHCHQHHRLVRHFSSRFSVKEVVSSNQRGRPFLHSFCDVCFVIRNIQSLNDSIANRDTPPHYPQCDNPHDSSTIDSSQFTTRTSKTVVIATSETRLGSLTPVIREH